MHGKHIFNLKFFQFFDQILPLCPARLTLPFEKWNFYPPGLFRIPSRGVHTQKKNRTPLLKHFSCASTSEQDEDAKGLRVVNLRTCQFAFIGHNVARPEDLLVKPRKRKAFKRAFDWNGDWLRDKSAWGMFFRNKPGKSAGPSSASSRRRRAQIDLGDVVLANWDATRYEEQKIWPAKFRNSLHS